MKRAPFLLILAVILASCTKAEITISTDRQQLQVNETAVITIEANKAETVRVYFGLNDDTGADVQIIKGRGSVQKQFTQPGEYLIQAIDFDNRNTNATPITIFVNP